MDSYSSSAKSLISAAIVIQTVFLVIGMLFFLFFALFSFGAGTVTSPSPFFPSLFGVGILGIGFIFSILWIFLNYFLLYNKITDDKIEEAKSNALILGILELLFDGLTPVTPIIVAYTKLSDSVSYGMKEKDDDNMF